MMQCSQTTRVTLFVIYIASIISALANPANLNYEDAYLLTEGANIVMLLLLSYCKQKVGDAFLASMFGVAFTLRATGAWQGGSRWDSLLVTIGMLVILQDAFYQALPPSVPHRYLLYLGFSCLIMPVLSALPHLAYTPPLEKQVLHEALRLSSEAYGIPKDGSQTLLGPLWTLYDAGTDTTAGVTRVINSTGGTDVYVYFAGSESRVDWKNNFNILNDDVPPDWNCTSAKKLRTHQGYMRAFKSVASQMLVALQNELSNTAGTSRIVFCGHSLGGALATMASLYAACKLPQLRPNIAVVTFGAPQVGDGNFVLHFNDVIQTSVRIVNPMDPVPRLLAPQLVHVKGYYPVGNLSLDNTLKAHSIATYTTAMGKSRVFGILASFAPAAVAGILIALYITWRLKWAR